MYRNEIITSYSGLSKALHWIIALLVVCMLIFGFFLDEIPDQYASFAYTTHKSTGIVILFLMMLRIIWLWHKGRPTLPETVALWQRTIARSVQYGLYLFLLLMPLSGWIGSMAAGRTPSFFGLFALPFPAIPVDKPMAKLIFEAHEIIAWILVSLISLHILGAFKHYFIDKDKVALKMFRD